MTLPHFSDSSTHIYLDSFPSFPHQQVSFFIIPVLPPSPAHPAPSTPLFIHLLPHLLVFIISPSHPPASLPLPCPSYPPFTLPTSYLLAYSCFFSHINHFSLLFLFFLCIQSIISLFAASNHSLPYLISLHFPIHPSPPLGPPCLPPLSYSSHYLPHPCHTPCHLSTSRSTRNATCHVLVKAVLPPPPPSPPPSSSSPFHVILLSSPFILSPPLSCPSSYCITKIKWKRKEN